jgi:isopentenyl-diphosphate delta-isomerase
MASPLNPTGPEGRNIPDPESRVQFENRKVDHIRLAMRLKNQAVGLSGLQQIQLLHEAMPDLNFDQIQLATKSLGHKLTTPFFVSSMTGGHKDSPKLNRLMAEACQRRGWRMGVGSQRRELGDSEAQKEWKKIRQTAGDVRLLGNLGLAQLIGLKLDAVQKLVDVLEAEAMIIHLNPLQECFQPEGTPRFQGGLKAIQRLCKALSVPVIIKETGCGFSKPTLKRLKNIGVAAVDMSGLGGTHWGRIEGDRGKADSKQNRAAETFAGWGVSTVESLLSAVEVRPDYEIWASGGVRTGLDAAKLLAIGATQVGLAMPILDSALKGETALDNTMSTLEFELKTALFCTGSKDLKQLQKKKVWKWQIR